MPATIIVTGDVTAVQAFFVEFVGMFIHVFTVFGAVHRKAAPGWPTSPSPAPAPTACRPLSPPSPPQQPEDHT